MSYSDYYDEDGIYHNHDGNTIRETMRCTNGHVIDRQVRNTCKCGWKQEIRTWVLPEGCGNGAIHYNKDESTYVIMPDGTHAPVEHRILTDEELVRYY